MECDDVGGHMRGLMIEYAPANRSLELLRPLTEQKIVIPGSTADMMQQQKAREKQRLELSYTIALLAGGCAGTAVDVTLFPIDTIKTRMQVTSESPAPPREPPAIRTPSICTTAGSTL